MLRPSFGQACFGPSESHEFLSSFQSSRRSKRCSDQTNLYRGLRVVGYTHKSVSSRYILNTHGYEWPLYYVPPELLWPDAIGPHHLVALNLDDVAMPDKES